MRRAHLDGQHRPASRPLSILSKGGTDALHKASALVFTLKSLSGEGAAWEKFMGCIRGIVSDQGVEQHMVDHADLSSSGVKTASGRVKRGDTTVEVLRYGSLLPSCMWIPGRWGEERNDRRGSQSGSWKPTRGSVGSLIGSAPAYAHPPPRPPARFRCCHNWASRTPLRRSPGACGKLLAETRFGLPGRPNPFPANGCPRYVHTQRYVWLLPPHLAAHAKHGMS